MKTWCVSSPVPASSVLVWDHTTLLLCGTRVAKTKTTTVVAASIPLYRGAALPSTPRRHYSSHTDALPPQQQQQHNHPNHNHDHDPCWPLDSQPLGHPLPTDEHACSVSLPTWSAVVGYEEGDPRITGAMKCGYPRFVYHPYVLQLMQVALERHGKTTTTTTRDRADQDDEYDCLVLPSRDAANRCHRFLWQALYGGSKGVLDNALDHADNETVAVESDSSFSRRIRTVDLKAADVHAVLFPAQTTAGTEAKAYWQHTGEIVSSRRAEQALKALGMDVRHRVTCGGAATPPLVRHESSSSSLDGDGDGSSITENGHGSSATIVNDPFTELRGRIGGWANVPPENVVLTPSGMASIYTALRSARRYRFSKAPAGTGPAGAGGGRSIVFGFPYLDTLKLCSRPEFCPDGVEFFGLGDDNDMDNLEQLLQRSPPNRFCALFTEVPSNPLLQCPDMHRLRELANAHDFALVVDDTIGNFLNVDLLGSGLADAVCTSLTKLVSGRGDAMAGSVVTNPHTPRGQWMRDDLLAQPPQPSQGTFGLFPADARAVASNSIDFIERNDRINANAEGLADWLKDHPDVERVYYPKLSMAPHHYTSVQRGGYGGLMSVTLPPHMCQRTFYDSLNVAKGPSLGTNYTLVCPYTLLAHYHELDFAISCRVPPNLLRISVGLECLDALKGKFEAAFRTSRLHPKVCLDRLQQPSAQRRAYTTAVPLRAHAGCCPPHII